MTKHILRVTNPSPSLFCGWPTLPITRTMTMTMTSACVTRPSLYTFIFHTLHFMMSTCVTRPSQGVSCETLPATISRSTPRPVCERYTNHKKSHRTAPYLAMFLSVHSTTSYLCKLHCVLDYSGCRDDGVLALSRGP